MNKVFEKDGKQRIVQDKGEEVAAIFEGYKEVTKDEAAEESAPASSASGRSGRSS